MKLTMKQARIGANMRQQDVADSMGVHVQTYMRMEKNSGDISINQGKTFARIVNVNFEDIIFANNSN